MAENTPKTDDPKATNANIVKNLLFAAFIILAIFFCFSQFNKSQKIKEVNRAIELVNEAREANPNDYAKAQEALDILEALQEDDFSKEEVIAEYVKTKSLCYSTLADKPELDAKQSEQYYLKAYALDENNPDIPDVKRGQFQGLSPEEIFKRAGIRKAAEKAMEEGAKQLERMEKGISDEVKDAVEETKDAAADVAEETKAAAADAVEAVKETAEDVAEEAKEAAEDAVEAVKEAAE